MSFKIEGWNEFYEGWLARCFEQPINKTKGDSWQEGWKTAHETSEIGRMQALCEEIRRGINGTAKPCAHVVVEYIQEVPK